MDSKKYQYNVKLGRSKNQPKYMADYINKNDDKITRSLIHDIPSHNVLDNVKWSNIFGYITVSEFITRYEKLLSKHEIKNLNNISNLKNDGYSNPEIDHIISVIGGLLLGNIVNNIKYMTSHIVENSIKDIEDHGVKVDSWYSMYHIDIGYLNKNNKEKFQKLMDNYFFNRAFLEFKFRIFTVDEINSLFNRLLPYSPEELNLLYLPDLEENKTNQELIIRLYKRYIHGITEIYSLGTIGESTGYSGQGNDLHQVLKKIYDRGLRRYGF